MTQHIFNDQLSLSELMKTFMLVHDKMILCLVIIC